MKTKLKRYCNRLKDWWQQAKELDVWQTLKWRRRLRYSSTDYFKVFPQSIVQIADNAIVTIHQGG